MKTESYQNIKEFVERPIKNREMVITKRGKYIVPRKYHLTEEELSKIKKDKQLTNEIGGDVFVNPYVKMGCYHASIESLRILGPNQWHSFVNVRDKMQEIMSATPNNKGITSWEIFEKCQSETSKDVNGKIMYNMVVLCSNQVMSSPTAYYGDPTTAVGGHIVGHNSTFRIYMRPGKEGSIFAKLIDSPNLPQKDCNFWITKDGFSEVKPDKIKKE